jgi:hypothetical protein
MILQPQFVMPVSESGGSPDNSLCIEVTASNLQYFSFPISPTSPATFTWAFWIYWSSGSVPVRDSSGTAGTGTFPLFDNAGTVFTRHGGKSTVTTGITTASLKNRWLHVALVSDAQRFWTYFDSVPVISNALGGNVAIISPVIFGRNGVGTDSANAKFADVRTYNRALSESEVSMLYANRDGGVVTDGLTAWLKFSEGTADAVASGTDSLIDSSGSGRHGTPYNGPYYRNF